MLRALTFAVVTLWGPAALAQAAQTDANQQLIEQTVVKNRLYTMKGRFEGTVTVGFTLINRLTEHYNFNGALGYNVSDTIAFELRGGYALSNQTGLARQVGSHLLGRDPTKEVKITSDLSGLWEMEANGVLGIRWAPLYGKISLMAELPVHFQAYLWGGGGGGTFHRQSLVYCQGGVSSPRSSDDVQCGNGYLTDDKATWLASAAFGMRFFTHQGGALKVEVRDYIFPDSYLVDIDRSVAERGGQTGSPSTNPGLTNLVMVDIGYTLFF